MFRQMPLVLLLSATAGLIRGSDAPLAHLGAANRFLSQDRFEEAADEFRSALRESPQLLPARRGLAVCLFELRQYSQAETLFSELLNHPVVTPMAHYYLGRIDLLNNNFADAMRQFLSISRSQPFRDELYFLGMAYYKTGAWQACAATLRASVKENPRDFRSHQLLARALQKLGQHKTAAQEFAETRRLLTYYSEGSQALKGCAQELSDRTSTESGAACDQLSKSDDVDKLTALGMLLGNTRFFDKAEVAWKRAASLDPDSPEILYDLALTCFHLNDRICARDNARAAIQAFPDFPEANVLYASVLYMLGSDTEALPALRKAHALNPDDSTVRELFQNELVLWSEQYAHTGRPDDARSLLSELEALKPLRPEQEQRLFKLRRLLNQEKE